MPSFSKMKDMYRLQREAKKIRKELANIHVEAEGPGVQVVISAEQEIVSIRIAPDANPEQLPATLKDCINRGMKKAQLIASEKMQGVMGEMGLGMGGGQQ